MINPIRVLLAVLTALLLIHPSQASEADSLKFYPCDPTQSNLTYTAKTGLATVKGVSKVVACTVWVNPDTTAFRIRVGTAVRSFKSGIGLRDTHAMKAVKPPAFMLSKVKNNVEMSFDLVFDLSGAKYF